MGSQVQFSNYLLKNNYVGVVAKLNFLQTVKHLDLPILVKMYLYQSKSQRAWECYINCEIFFIQQLSMLSNNFRDGWILNEKNSVWN